MAQSSTGRNNHKKAAKDNIEVEDVDHSKADGAKTEKMNNSNTNFQRNKQKQKQA